MGEEPLGVETDPSFVTVVSDGAYAHFLEGFVSLLFFQDTAIPKHTTKRELDLVDRKRHIMFEVRMSVNATKLLAASMKEGLKTYASTGLFFRNRDFWNYTSPRKTPTQLHALDKETDIDLEKVLTHSLEYILDKLPEEGVKKVNDILMQCIHEHIEEIKQIAEEYKIDVEEIGEVGRSKKSNKV